MTRTTDSAVERPLAGSNPVPVARDIWIVEGNCVNFYGFQYPTRMVVVRLRCGDLWLWSPIEYSERLATRLTELGPVTHLVSPNKIHHLFLKSWQSAFPETKLWGPGSTIKKRQDLSFQPRLTDQVPIEWHNEIDQVWFNGSFFMDEVVFFHRLSRTAILADLSENFSQNFLQKKWKPWQQTLARYWGIVEGKGYAPLEWRLSFIRKDITRQAKARVLAWNPQRVIMAHGEWQRQNGKAYLETSFSWITDTDKRK